MVKIIGVGSGAAAVARRVWRRPRDGRVHRTGPHTHTHTHTITPLTHSHVYMHMRMGMHMHMHTHARAHEHRHARTCTHTHHTARVRHTHSRACTRARTHRYDLFAPYFALLRLIAGHIHSHTQTRGSCLLP